MYNSLKKMWLLAFFVNFLWNQMSNALHKSDMKTISLCNSRRRSVGAEVDVKKVPFWPGLFLLLVKMTILPKKKSSQNKSERETSNGVETGVPFQARGLPQNQVCWSELVTLFYFTLPASAKMIMADICFVYHFSWPKPFYGLMIRDLLRQILSKCYF